MNIRKRRNRALLSLSLLIVTVFSSLPVAGQDLVPVSDVAGGSSVFVFRSSSRSAAKRVVSIAKPTRSKAQRMAAVVNIKKQYDTIARTAPKLNRAKAIEPDKLPPGVRTMPKDKAASLFAGVGEYYIDKSDLDNSIQFFREALNLNPANVNGQVGLSEALALKGNELLVKDQNDAAKAFFLEALKNNPKNSAAYFGLGDVYSELDQNGEAIAAYEKSLENNKDLTEIYVPLGILYYQTGEIAKADAMLTKALASSADSTETQLFLGVIRYSQNRNEEALAAFQKATELEPNYADAYFRLGETLVRLKRFAEAAAAYQKATTLKPNYLEAFVGLGGALYELGNFAEAVNAYKQAAKLKNDNADVFAGLGDAYRQMGNFNDAASNYNLATLFMTRLPNFNKDEVAEIYGKIGYVIGRQCEINTRNFTPCNWPTAVKALEKAVELTGNAFDYSNLGWAYYNAARVDMDAKRDADAQAKLQLAKTTLEKAISMNPASVEGPLQNLGAVQIDLKDYPGAIETLKKVVDKRADWNFAKYALGTAYFKTNDFDNAAKLFHAAVDQDPKYVAALSSWGYAEIKRKNGKDVKKIVERLKALDMAEGLKLEAKMKEAKL